MDYTSKGHEVDYRDVKKSSSAMEEMLQLSGGRRDVPLIQHEGKVTIGYGGA